MVLIKDEKKKIIKKFAREKGDTGSPEVQIALLSVQIDKLAKHLRPSFLSQNLNLLQ